MSKSGKEITADAAVAPPTEITYTSTILKQYAGAGGAANPASVDYSNNDFGAPNSDYGDTSLSGNVVTISKKSGTRFILGYVAFKSEITVPAMTEYKVDYKSELSIYRKVASSSAESVCMCAFLYFGNTSVTGTTDQSATLTFYHATPQISSTSGATYIQNALVNTKSNAATQTDTVVIPQITYTNSTNQPETYTAYFAFKASAGRANSSSTANQMTATATMSAQITVTPVSAPTVDSASKVYNGNNQNFTFTYDMDRVEVTKAVYTPLVGSTQTLFDAATSTGSNPVNSSGVMQAKDAGTYTVSFDIMQTCGSVWNSATNDQTTKTVTFNITKKQLTVPTVSASQQYTGSTLTFSLIDFNSGQEIKMDGVTAGVSGHTVTGAGGAALTDTTDTFEVTSVDQYTVTLSPRETNNYAWNDGTGGSGSRTIVFEVDKKELGITFNCSEAASLSADAEWAFGDAGVTLEVTDDRYTDGNGNYDNLNLLIYYDAQANVLTGTGSDNVKNITMPQNIAVGLHTVKVELNGTSGDNANYKITSGNSNTFTFNIKASSAGTNFGWLYYEGSSAGASGTIANNDKLAYKYSGNTTNPVTYRVELDTSQLPSHISIDTTKYSGGYQTNSYSAVGTYTSTVALVSNNPNMLFTDSNNNQSATTDITLNWEIEKGTFDFSGLVWTYEYLDASGAQQSGDYSSALDYNDGRSITLNVKASTLPAGFTIDNTVYFGDRQSAVNTYTATVNDAFCVYDRVNFNAPLATDLTKNWEIKKKNLFTQWKPEVVQFNNTNGSGSGSYIKMVLRLAQGYVNYVTYQFYDMDNGAAAVTAADITNGASPTQVHNYKVEAYVDPAYATRYEVLDNGATPSTTFTTGSNNKIANVTIAGADCLTPVTADYDGQAHFGLTDMSIVGTDGQVITDYTVTYYANSVAAGNEISGAPKNAGKYVAEIVLGTSVVNDYILLTSLVDLVILPQEIALPTLGEIIFTGSDIVLSDYLSGSYAEYANIISISGDYKDIRNVSQNGYVARLEITDTNYKWAIPQEQAAPVKALLKYTLASGEFSVTAGDEQTAELKWNIAPLVVDSENMWNKGKDGATLTLPANIKALIDGETLTLGYRYYDGATGEFLETPEIKGKKQFKVEAAFGGFDAENGNVVFKTGETTVGTVSPAVNYTVPQSGASAFFGNALSFVKSNWLWFVIALAVLLFLIILICIIRHRRKTKEERLAKKEAEKEKKEEEKQRKEEERIRKEEEREASKQKQQAELEAQKAKQQAELELAKAKQEAELAKIKAQAGMAGAGVAAMAMAQQPQQQQMPMPQQMPQQQPMPQQMPMQAQMQQYPQTLYPPPAQAQPPMPQQPYPQYAGGELAEIKAELTRLRELRETDREFAAMRTEHRTDRELSAMKTELEMAKMQNTYGAPRLPQQPYGGGQGVDADMLAEKFGHMMATMLKSMGMPVPDAAPKELPQSVEESKPVSVAYPPDAVVTTTTTVDTTKNVAPKRSREDELRALDIDGFYDTFEENK